MSLSSWSCEENLVDPFPDPLKVQSKTYYLYKGPGQYRKVPGMITLKVPLTAENLIFSYPKGIFPYFETASGNHIWFSFPNRGILDVNEVHLPTRLRELLRKGNYEITMDTAFRDVVLGCMHQERPGTWINQRIVREYTRLHEMGHAHSVEVRNLKGELVGGTYGVMINGVFSGESMFYKESGAGLIAFATLIAYLKERGIKWFDTQMVTDTTGRLGAKEIPIVDFFKRVAEARAGAITFKDPGDTSDSMVARLPNMSQFVDWVLANETARIREAEKKSHSKKSEEERVADEERKRVERRRSTEGKEKLIAEKNQRLNYDLTFWFRSTEGVEEKIGLVFPGSFETLHEYYGHWIRDHVFTRSEFGDLTDIRLREDSTNHGYDIGVIDNPKRAEELLRLFKDILSKRFKELF